MYWPSRLSFIYIPFLHSFWSVRSGRQRPSPLASIVGNAAAFAVNAALVARQWQHRAWTVSLHPPINVEHEAGQAASIDFQVFDVTRLGIEPNLPAPVARAQPTVPLTSFFSRNVRGLSTNKKKNNKRGKLSWEIILDKKPLSKYDFQKNYAWIWCKFSLIKTSNILTR